MCSAGQSAPWFKKDYTNGPRAKRLLFTTVYPMLLCENIQADLKLSISHGSMIVYRYGRARSGQVGQVRLGQVMSGQVMSGQVRYFSRPRTTDKNRTHRESLMYALLVHRLLVYAGHFAIAFGFDSLPSLRVPSPLSMESLNSLKSLLLIPDPCLG